MFKFSLKKWSSDPPSCLLLLMLLVGVLVIYGQVSDFSFVTFDDASYVYKNEDVNKGLSLAGVEWAFTAFHSANWHPLTWLSHMLDVSLFGLDAGNHHLSSLFWHLLNTLLVFVVLQRFTGSILGSALVAALFAWHPLRVESVAWIAERKDLLCAFFWLLALLFYHFYCLRPSWRRYLPVLIAGACSLLSKPMAVTLPFLLLLLDYWPLQRNSKYGWRRLVVEKLPLVVVVIITAGLTYQAQHQAGAVASQTLSFGMRFANAVVAYISYVQLLFWPHDLAVFYRYQTHIPVARVIISTLLLLLSVGWAFRLRKKYPFFFTGWFWFLGTLVPVIGLVQVGGQALADRYTYFPAIGFWLAVVFSLQKLFSPKYLRLVNVVMVVATLVLLPLSWKQTAYWRDSIALFQRVLEIDPDSYVAYNSLGVAYDEQEMWLEASSAFARASAIKPNSGLVWFNWGLSKKKAGQLEDATKYFQRALHFDPGMTKANINLAVIAQEQGRPEAALEWFQKARELKPGVAHSKKELYNTGNIYLAQGKIDKAIKSFRQVLALDPNHLEARVNLAVGLFREGQLEEAIEELRHVLQQDSKHEKASYNLQQLESLLSN